jgi:L-alanine-DL-glutamate epimerase-like enolase superfamily enzyme
MSTYDALAALPLVVESYELAGLDQDVSSNFRRRTTVVALHGAGESGVGEDVTYDGDEQLRQQAAGPVLDLVGTHTLDSFSDLVASLDLFPGAPEEAARRFGPYRRWAFESAALDLALRQAGTSLAGALGREPRPVRFVVSTRLGDPPSTERLLGLRVEHPETRFKLDPTSDWDEALVEELAALDAVDTVDLKGAYKGTIVDQPADPGLYRLVATGLASTWIEDPDLSSPETDEALRPFRARVSWDAVIHSVADIEGLPFRPGAINVKPSRFGCVSELLAAYDHCAARGIPVYGGGQFELGPGRGQIQYLASLLCPDAPNDVAPSGYNDPTPAPGLPPSPLTPMPSETGFRWGADGLPKSLRGHTV